MPRKPLAEMPDDARVWVFGLDRPLDEAATAEVRDEVEHFLEHWQAHGHPLTCAGEWRYDRFLIVAVDERTAPPSGCSIDAMVGALRTLGGRMGFNMIDNAPVWYRGQASALARVSRQEFAAAVLTGEVTADTVVFDNTVTRLGEVRAGKWETRAEDSWHARAFRLGVSVERTV